MGKRILFGIIIIMLLAAGCAQPPTETPTPRPTETPPVTETPTPAPVPEPRRTERAYIPPDDGLTHIRIDGDPSDWMTYPPVSADPVGDSIGNVDVTYVYAITNDTYLYLLFEVAGEIGSYVQIDVDINPAAPGGWPPDYMVTTRPYENPHPHLARIEDEQFVHHAEQGNVAQGVVFEMRVPLHAFDGPAPETVSLRVMNGVCCGAQWIVVDKTRPVAILRTDEIEPPLVSWTDTTAPDSAFCRDAVLLRADTFQPAAIHVLPGYEAEYFIPPSGLNVPSDVVVTEEGDIVVASSRASALHLIKPDGTISVYAQVFVYALGQDVAGRLYGYNFPSGEVFHITPGREDKLIARMPQTACESTLAVAPDATIYIGFNYCSGDTIGASSLYVIPPGGGTPRELIGNMKGVQALDVAADGTLYAVIGESLQIIDTITGKMTQVAQLPERGSFHGLAVADDGTVYVSSGDFDTSGNLYRITPDGNVSVLASFENNGLEGLAISADGEVIGTQRAIGGLQAVGPDGSVRTLVEPNGLVSPHTIAFSPCGELVAVNDEAGRLTLATPDGHNKPFTKVISFQPPQTFLAFAPDGWYVTGESAPGFPTLVNRYLPSGLYETLADDIPDVSGVAVGSDGSVYASGTRDGQIIRILPDGTRKIVADGLETPQALAIGPSAVLYVVTGGRGWGKVFTTPETGDTVTCIAPDGSADTLARVEGAAGVAVGPDGWLYVPGGGKVHRISQTGDVEVFASGFGSARGVAFDVAGNLYVADDKGNNIVRISGFLQSTLRGLITNAVTGVPLEGARLRVVQADPPFAGQVVAAGSDGAFSLPVTLGTYQVTAWADDYQTVVEAGVIVGDDPQEVSFSLTPVSE